MKSYTFLKILLIAILLVNGRIMNAQVITVHPFAGTNITAFYNGVPGTTAQLSNPLHLASDDSGNIYIEDIGNYAVRKYNQSTGIITTIAGNGKMGYSGDGGPAINAELSQEIWGVAIDHSGNVFISDLYNYRIRKVNTSGIITTVVGGGTLTPANGVMATNASITCIGVAVDRTGNIYFADNNTYVWKVNTSGILSIVAGNGTGGFSGDGGPATAAEVAMPCFLFVDTLHNIYINDFGNYRIRKVDTSGIINTIIGNGSGSNIDSGDGGPATNAVIGGGTESFTIDDSGNIFIAQTGVAVIRKVNTSGIISTIAGGGTSLASGIPALNAKFYYNWGITADHSGNLFTCSNGDSVMRKINNLNIINTVVGNGGYGGDGGLAIKAPLENPKGVCSDNSGNIFITDIVSNTVRKVTTSGIISTIAGIGNDTVGYIGDGGLATLARLNKPVSVAVDRSGNTYISDQGNNVIRKVNTSGYITTYAGNGVAGYSGDGSAAVIAKLNHPYGIATDTSGNLYISDQGSIIRKVDATSGIISTYAGNDSIGYSGDGGPATNAELNSPAFFAFDRNNNLYIADYNNNVIRKVDATTGIITTVAGEGSCDTTLLGDGGPATAASLCQPIGIAIDDSGNIHTTTAERVRHVTSSTGTVSTTAGSALVGLSPDGKPPLLTVFNGPAGICTDHAGNIYIADAQNRCVRRIGLATSGVQQNHKPTANLKLYPNPNNGIFTIEGIAGSNGNDNKYTVTITNVLGQEVYHQGTRIKIYQYQ